MAGERLFRRRPRGGVRAVAGVLCLVGLLMADDILIASELLPPTPPVPAAKLFAPSPYNFLFTGNDYFRLTVRSSMPGLVLTVNYRMQTPTDPSFVTGQSFPLSGNYNQDTFDFPIGEGYLLNVSVFVQGGHNTTGAVFARLQVMRGLGNAAMVVGTVVQGYAMSNRDLAWPGSLIQNSLDGPGRLRVITGTAPANQVDINEACPPLARWLVTAFQAVLATDATIANRRVSVLASSGLAAQWRVAQPGVIPANTTRRSYFAAGLPMTLELTTAAPLQGLPDQAFILGGDTIQTSTENFQAADHYGAPVYTVREWLDES